LMIAATPGHPFPAFLCLPIPGRSCYFEIF
jgi:hypothetical protein